MENSYNGATYCGGRYAECKEKGIENYLHHWFIITLCIYFIAYIGQKQSMTFLIFINQTSLLRLLTPL